MFQEQQGGQSGSSGVRKVDIEGEVREITERELMRDEVTEAIGRILAFFCER